MKKLPLLALVVIIITQVTAQTIGLVSPNNSIRGKSTTVGISGNTTNFLQGSNTVWISQDTFTIYGINVNPFANNFLITDMVIPATGRCGSHDLHIMNATDGQVTKPDGFIVNCPVITNVQPSSAFQGDSIEITITAGFVDFTQGANTVTFSNGSSTIIPSSVIALGSGSLKVTMTFSNSLECDFYNIQINGANGFFEDTAAFEVKCFTCVKHDIAIDAGWNMISSYIIPDEPDMLDVIDSIASDIFIVKDALGNTAIPSLGINVIGNWEVEQGYKLKAVNVSILTVGCTAVDPSATPISLSIGWNMIAYLRTTNMNITTALNGIVGDVLLVKDVNGNTYIPNFGINNIGSMKPGQGYKVKMSNPAVLTYPANN